MLLALTTELISVIRHLNKNTFKYRSPKKQTHFWVFARRMSSLQHWNNSILLVNMVALCEVQLTQRSLSNITTFWWSVLWTCPTWTLLKVYVGKSFNHTKKYLGWVDSNRTDCISSLKIHWTALMWLSLCNCDCTLRTTHLDRKQPPLWLVKWPFTFTSTFMHLADYFIQSDLQ